MKDTVVQLLLNSDLLHGNMIQEVTGQTTMYYKYDYTIQYAEKT